MRTEGIMRRIVWILLFAVLSSALAACGGKNSIIPPDPGPNPDNRTVSGTVTDSDGNPVPGLNVLLDGQNTGITTDTEGGFFLNEAHFNQGATSNYHLSLGLGGIIFAEDLIKPSLGGNADFVFEATGDEIGLLTGTVFDEREGNTLDGAIVIAFAYEGGLFFDKTENGAYSMELPSGHWLLLGWKDGFNPGVSVVEVQGGGESVQDIHLTPTGPPKPPAGIMVSGTVTDSVTGSPVADALVTMMVDTGCWGYPEEVGPAPLLEEEGPVEGGGSSGSAPGWPGPDEPAQQDSAIEYMPAMPYMPSYQETLTDASGHFEFADGVVGYSAYFTVNADNYLPANQWSELPLEGDTFVIDLSVEPLIMTSVTGRTIDDNGDPVPNAWVEFIFQGGSGGGWAMPMMDTGFASGWVEGVNDAAEDYAERSDGAPMPLAGAGAPTAGEQGGNNDFDNPMFMQFLHQQRSNRDSSQMEGDPYFTGYYSVQADENGEFSIDELAAGPYYVFADAFRYLPFNDMVEVAPDGSTEVEVVLINTPVGSVEGNVTNEDGEPLPDVLVNCVQPNRDPFTFTDSSGHFRIDNIPEGLWIVGAYAAGYAAEGVEVFIGDNDVRRIDFTLVTYTPPVIDRVYFTGTVIDGTTGEPVIGARLYVVSSDNKYWEDAITDSEGVFTMNLVPTEYAIDIDAQDQGFANLYTFFWVDTAYPQMEFYLWPYDSNVRGGWGGIETAGTRPPPDKDWGGGGGWPDDDDEGTETEPPIPL